MIHFTKTRRGPEADGMVRVRAGASYHDQVAMGGCGDF